MYQFNIYQKREIGEKNSFYYSCETKNVMMKRKKNPKNLSLDLNSHPFKSHAAIGIFFCGRHHHNHYHHHHNQIIVMNQNTHTRKQNNQNGYHELSRIKKK